MLLKRALDILFSISSLFILSPLFLLFYILIKVNLGSPVFFIQERPGKDGKVFKMIKFRSMTNETNKNGELLSDAKRITKFGKFVRKTSIDELPELINILKGDMSLIGPRPLLIEYLPLYSEEQKRRHSVRPGLSGLAQINGRNLISWEQRFKYDVEYVDNLSFWLDANIFIRTFVKVIQRSGITSASSITMEKFKGTHITNIDDSQNQRGI